MSVKQTNKVSWLNKRYVLSIRSIKRYRDGGRVVLAVRDLLGLAILSLFLLLGFGYLLFRFTPFNQLIQNSGNNGKKEMVKMLAKTDSLENEVDLYQAYFYRLQDVLKGDRSIDSLDLSPAINPEKYDNIILEGPSDEELALRQNVADKDKFAIEASEGQGLASGFLLPLNGVVSSNFERDEKHFGVDITAPKNTAVKSMYSGNVIIAHFSDEHGYVIAIAHAGNYVSIYKHNERLLKKQGDNVRTGEAIAIIGETGSESTGHHLHFEIWHDGIAQNPNDYFNFGRS